MDLLPRPENDTNFQHFHQESPLCEPKLLPQALPGCAPLPPPPCPIPTTGAATQFTVTDAVLAAPYSVQLSASGTIDLTRCGYSTGYSNQIPTLSFFYAGPSSEAQLSLSSSYAGCDPVLLVHSPTAGWYFNDDTHSDTRNSWVHIGLEAGRTDVWAGTYNGRPCDVLFEIN